MSSPRAIHSLACIACLAVTGAAFAQSSTDQSRYRPRLLERGSRLFGGRDSGQRETRRWNREEPVEEPSRPVMTEPVKLPPYRGMVAGVPQPRVLTATADTDAADDPLLQLVHRAIAITSQRHLDVNRHMPWQIMHAVLALRGDLYLRSGHEYVRAVDWISADPVFRNEHWFEATEHGGRAHPFNVPYHFEGHVNQFLALLAMSNLPLDHGFQVADGKTVTMADMINQAKMTVNNREEITWTLWFLTHYVDQDTEWVNARGEPWSMEELVRIQTQATVTEAPCGGTHGLFALAYARNSYLHHHGRLRGVWFEADQKVKRHIEIARSLQNSDGSFSTEMFKGPGHSRDYNERIPASGHMLEWLMMALPQNQLDDNWVRRGVASVASDLIHHRGQLGECGPVFHALHALVLYADRVTPKTPPSLANEDSEPQPQSPSAPQPRSQPERQPQSVTESQPRLAQRPTTHAAPTQADSPTDQPPEPSQQNRDEQPTTVTRRQDNAAEQETAATDRRSREAAAPRVSGPNKPASPSSTASREKPAQPSHSSAPQVADNEPDVTPGAEAPQAKADESGTRSPSADDGKHGNQQPPAPTPARSVADDGPQLPLPAPQTTPVAESPEPPSRMTRWAAQRAARIARRYARRYGTDPDAQPLQGPATQAQPSPTNVASEPEETSRRR